MRKIRTTQPDGAVTTDDGPAYRRNVSDSVRKMLAAGEQPPFTADEVRRLPLDELAARDNAWATANKPGYRVDVFEEG
jgi:hypothetical protein